MLRLHHSLRAASRILGGCVVLVGAGDEICHGEAALPAPATAPEALCGPDVVTVGDAWEHVKLEREEVRRLLERGDWIRWPQRMAALAAHVRFMERKAIMVFGPARMKITMAMETITDRQGETNQMALAGDGAGLQSEWADLQAPLQMLEGQFPAEALIPTASLAHLLPSPVPVMYASVSPMPELAPGKCVEVTLRLRSYRPGEDKPYPITASELVVTHEAPLHALICDATLTDYQHVHPRPGPRPGEWICSFTPRLSGPYRVWLNGVPKLTGREEFPYANLCRPLENPHTPTSARTPSLNAQSGDLCATLLWESGHAPHDKELAAARILLTHADGRPVTNLEPLMGAFAHLVGFSEDFTTVLHLHPHGAKPAPGEHAGPEITFQLRPPTGGFFRLFLQVLRAGQIETLPFGFVAGKG